RGRRARRPAEPQGRWQGRAHPVVAQNLRDPPVHGSGLGRFLGWRGSSGGTKARRPLPSTSDHPSYVLRAWSCSHMRSSSSRRVWWVRVQSSGLSFSSRHVRVHASLVHIGACHHRAILCAMVGDRRRFVTLTTSTPLVTTSLTIASPNSSRATRAGIAPRPA